MIVTTKMREYASQHFGVGADASEDDVKQAVLERLANGELTSEKLHELSTEKAPEPKAPETPNQDKMQQLGSIIATAVESSVEKAMAKVMPEKATIAGSQNAGNPDSAPEAPQRNVADNLPANNPDPETVLRGAADFAEKNGNNLRVKKVSEQFSHTKGALVWEKNSESLFGQKDNRKDQPVKYHYNPTGRPGAGSDVIVDDLSEAEWAKCGAWLKYQFCKTLGKNPRTEMREQELALLKETLHEDRWIGSFFGEDHKDVYPRKAMDLEIKTVLDDSTSGGQNAVPEFFDTRLITTPLLYGEVFPFVEVVPVARGSAADGASHGTVTPVATAEGSAISEFSTTSFVSAFDTTFFPVSFALTFGKDFLQDALPQFAQSVMNQIGARHLQWLDDQIVNGDGTTEPQGLDNASLTAAPTGSNTHATYDFGDLLNLVFTVDKPHRNAFGGNATRLIMNDTQYKEFRNEVTGVTGDERPLFGMNLFNYELATVPVSIENNLANGKVIFANLRGYRMYRRQGLEFMRSTEGSTLMLSNEELLMARARWGGQITLTGYGASLST